MFRYSPTAWYFTLVWLAVGFGIYYFYAKPRKREHERTPIIMEQRLALEPVDDRFTALVPIANPASLPVLIQPAVEAARKHDGAVVLLHVITVPDQLPLSAGRRYLKESRDLTEEAAERVEAEGVPVQTLVRIAHNAADAIIQTTEENDIDLLIMGWRGDGQSTSSYIGANIDRIVREVNCEALIVQQERTPPFDKILVPISDPLQIRTALEAAQYFCPGGCSHVDVVHVFRPDTDESEKEKYISSLNEQIAVEQNGDSPYDPASVNVLTFTDDNVVGAITGLSKDYDCVILGMTRDSWLRQRFLGSKPGQFAGQVEPPIVIVQPRSSSVAYGLYRVRHYLRGGYRVVGASAEKELTEQGILLPQKEAQRLVPPTFAQSLPTLIGGIGALIGVALMYFGYGTSTTWLGAVIYILSLFFFTIMTVRAVKA